MDAVENREEVGELQLLETSGRNMIMKRGGSLKQKSNQTRRMKVLAFTAYGKIIKQEIHIITLYFYLIPSAISFALARLWCFWKVWRLPKSVWYADDQSIIQSTPALNAKERNIFPFHRLYNESKKSDLTFASISFVSWFWNRNLILLLPSSDDPFSWENLYLHSTAYNGGLNYAY